MADRNNRTVTFQMAVRGWQQVQAAAKGTGKSFRGLGDDADYAGRKARSSERGWGIFERRQATTRKATEKTRLSLKGLAKAGAGLGAGYLAFGGLEQSVDTVDRLGEATLNLHRIQGLSYKSAAQLSAVFDVNNVSTRTSGAAFGILSKNVTAATRQQNINAVSQKYSVSTTQKLTAAHDAYQNKLMGLGATARDNLKRQQYADAYQSKRQKIIAAGTAKSAIAGAKGIGSQAEAFKQLGISQAELKRGNVNEIFMDLDERFTKLKGGTKKNALALAVFGRGYKNILPLFKDGEVSLKQQLKWANQYGVTLGIQSPKQFEKFKAAQLQAKYASEGFKVQVGTQLMPALINFLPVLASGVRDLTSLGHWFGKNDAAAKGLKWAFVGLAAAWPLSKAAHLAGSMFKIVKYAKQLGRVKGAANIVGDIAGTKSPGGALSTVSKLRGATPETPLYVAVVNGGLPTPGGKGKGLIKDIEKGAGGGGAAGLGAKIASKALRVGRLAGPAGAFLLGSGLAGGPFGSSTSGNDAVAAGSAGALKRLQHDRYARRQASIADRQRRDINRFGYVPDSVPGLSGPTPRSKLSIAARQARDIRTLGYVPDSVPALPRARRSAAVRQRLAARTLGYVPDNATPLNGLSVPSVNGLRLKAPIIIQLNGRNLLEAIVDQGLDMELLK